MSKLNLFIVAVIYSTYLIGIYLHAGRDTWNFVAGVQLILACGFPTLIQLLLAKTLVERVLRRGREPSPPKREPTLSRAWTIDIDVPVSSLWPRDDWSRDFFLRQQELALEENSEVYL